MPTRPGLTLLDPKIASQSKVVRKRGFLSDKEISEVEASAIKINSFDPVPKWDTVYIQTDEHFRKNLPDIYSKIKKLVVDTDRENWGLLCALKKTVGLDDGVNIRCCEFHEYGKHARQICGPHIDTGSIFTVDIMLSSTEDFEGGVFITDSKKTPGDGSSKEDDPPHDHREIFEKGDAIVFASHKRHSVTPIKSGTRCVLVLEFWEGSECNKAHRCMNPSCAWDYDENDTY